MTWLQDVWAVKLVRADTGLTDFILCGTKDDADEIATLIAADDNGDLYSHVTAEIFNLEEEYGISNSI